MTFVNEWWLIASREYNVRIRKRSFLFFTFLGPIVFLASMVVPLFLTIDTSNKVEVIVQSNVPVVLDLPSSDFKWVYDKNNEIRLDAAVNKSFVLLNVHSKNKTIQLTDCYGLTKSQRIKLEKYAIQMYKEVLLVQTGMLQVYQPQIKFYALAPAAQSMDLSYIVAMASAVLIYFFIVFYGVQVMRGVIEEKSSRVVEIVLSSVRPFALMLGKILGIAGVCFTQFLFWAFSYLCIGTLVKAKYGKALDQFNNQKIDGIISQTTDIEQALEWNTILSNWEQLPIFNLALGFVGFFLLGYLLYAAIFATVASMTDNETETQQFSFPLTMPLFMMFLLAGPLLKDPNGLWLIVLSYFPLTSPIAMLLRISLGVDNWEVVLSLMILFVTFVTITYFSSKIFKKNILQYGSTFSWSNIFK